MSRRALVFGGLVLAVLLGSVQPANAAPRVFAKPQEFASGGGQPRVVIGPNGDAIVAWMTLRPGGVFVMRRDALGSPWSSPEKISDESGAMAPLRLARNDRGDVALAWGAYAGGASFRPRVAIAAPGRRFGAVEDVPLPPRAPATGGTIDVSHTFSWPEFAVGADGTIAIGYGESDPRGGVSRTVVSVRPPGGRFGAPQVLATSGVQPGPNTNPPKLAADGLGRLHAAWTMQPGEWTGGMRVFATEAGVGRPFGQARLVSGPTESVISSAELLANRRGDVVSVWNSGRYPSALFGSSGRVEVAQRAPSGGWTSPQPISAREASTDPTVALNDRGDAAAAWPTLAGMATSFRPAGGGFGPARPSPVTRGRQEQVAVGLDALGDSVALRVGQQVYAQRRVRDAAPEPEVAISSPGDMWFPTIAMDRFGNGIAAWATRRSGVDYIATAAYSALPPLIAKLRVDRRRFRFGSSEPAAMRITVRRKRGGRSASQTAVLRPGANKLKFSKRVRVLLRRKGRYVATIRTRDAGPRRATYKVPFKRR